MPDSLTALDLLLLLHAASTCLMAGLIWFVQIVHYPLMRYVRSEDFASFALAHQRRTTSIVAPAMLIEAATAILVVLTVSAAPSDTPPLAIAPATVPLAWLGLGLLAIVWAITFGVQVPIHVRLARRFGLDLLNRLVAINWIRTVGWTARAAIALWLLRVA